MAGHTPWREIKHKVRELDVVELTEPVAHLPAGAEGTVVDVHDDGTPTVEFPDEQRDLLDTLIPVPLDSLRIVERAPRSDSG